MVGPLPSPAAPLSARKEGVWIVRRGRLSLASRWPPSLAAVERAGQRAAERLHLHPVSGRHERRRVPDPGEPRAHPNVKCMHLAAGDGFVTMADGKPLYTFGFSDVTGLLPSQVVNGNGTRLGGLAAANYPAPTIHLKEGQEFYLSLTNVGMIMRPDLFDPHSVHFHGFPQAASVFDGVPESSATINMGSTFTYYYKIVDGLAGHLHVPLPRRGHRAHPDGDGRQPLHRPEAERDAAIPGTPSPRVRGRACDRAARVRLQRRRRLDGVRRRVPDPARLASTRTSTTSTSPSSRCPSRRWTTSTRC